jgi:hypothetical protein
MRITLTILVSLIAASLIAQDKGDLPDVKIEIINPLKVTLPRAERNFSKVPAMPLEPIAPPIIYDYSLISFSTPLYSPAIRPLRIKPPEQKESKANFVSAGFGNFTSPYLRGYVSLFPARSVTIGGVSFYHHSFGKGPVDEKNSSSSQTSITANVKASGNKITSEALAGWQARSANFYGYDTAVYKNVEKDTIEHTYQNYFLSAKFSNSKKSDFNYELKPSFSYLKDNFSARESDLVLGFNSSYKMKKVNLMLIDLSYSITSHKDDSVEAKPRHLFTVTPQYQFSPLENLTVRAGVTVAYENDSIDSKSFHVYPALSATYSLGKNFSAFGGINGGMEKVSLHTLSNENMWLNANIPIFHTNKSIEFSGGINGDLGSGFNFMTGFAIAQLKNYYLYQNDSLDRTRFNPVYDDVARSNFFAAVNFDRGNYSFRVRGDFFDYSTDVQREAWHKPTYKLDAYVVIKAANKLSIVPRFMMLGGMKAINFEKSPDEVVTLPSAIDLSTSIEYNFSEKLGAFLRFNNLLNRDYSLLYHYPVRGFQGLAGITWKF